MKTFPTIGRLLCAGCVLLAPLFAGCSTQTKMSDEDKANFKGGPMPANYKDPYMSPPQQPATVPPRAAAPK